MGEYSFPASHLPRGILTIVSSQLSIFRRRFCLAGLLVAFVGNLGFASADETVGSSDGHDYFEKYIRPLFAQHCYPCHSSKSGKRENNLALDSKLDWLKGGDQGPAIEPGSPEKSLLVRAVRYADPGLQMPPSKALSNEQIQRLEEWIRRGAIAPDPTSSRMDSSPSDPESGKRYWAFMPLSKAEIPVDLNANLFNATDALIQQKRHTMHLSPVRLASKSNLIRRVSIQLTGLPPTAEQVHEFLEDETPQAYEQLVESLLASPRFGERWGRHWLDLARYADSNGLDENFLFREAWRYRNWVIQAINQDLPFDEFVLMQIAGDLLPFDTIEQRDRQRIAAGFLLVGPKVLLGNDERNQRMEIADEQIDTIGKTFLGQSLGCARCHDHKFDPVPTADYYALAGIFASTRVMERRYMLGEQRVMERLVGLGPDGEQLDEAYEEYWRNQPKLKADKKKADTLLELLKKDSEEDFLKALPDAGVAVADAAKDATKSREERIAAQQAVVQELSMKLTAPAIPPRAMIPADIEEPKDEQIRISGQFDRLGAQVPRGFLCVLQDEPTSGIPSNESGRKSLARWLVDADQRSGQLTARVIANRVWYHLMGRGIVRTVDNFGRTGEPPTHPELLDYLAREFVESGWSLKHLVKQIVLSSTFQLSCDRIDENQQIDPDNRFFWRGNRRRMDPETFRDCLLMAADQLSLSWVGSTVSYLGDQATAVGPNKVRRRTDFPCRSLYLPIIRNDLPEIFDILDFANPHMTTGMRPTTNVPLQGLFFLNEDMIMEHSKATALRVINSAPTGDRAGLVRRLFHEIVGESPSEEEERMLSKAWMQWENTFRAEGTMDPETHSLSLVCHALFASSRFQYVE